jgi:hypothetical protein
MLRSILLLSCLITALASEARDDVLIRDNTSPAMIALCAPLQFPDSDWSVSGLRVGVFYSNCDVMAGLDLGFINRSRETRAFQIGFANITETMGGLQIGIINYADQAVGIQIGLVNVIADNTAPCLPLFNASF